VAVLTHIAPDPHRPGYRVLEVDRGRFASLPDEVIRELPLGEGTGLDRAMLERLQYLADVEAAYRAAIRAQARRPHAQQDLRRRLILKQHPPAAVDVALQRLDARGLIDDRRFAEHYVATRAARGRGPARLLRDLLRLGLDHPIAEAAVRVSLNAEGIDVELTLRRVAERRAASLSDLPLPVKRRRLAAYLSRRGYHGPSVRRLVEDLVAR
jgi:regulatory protein